jgi:hypothetical protein
MASVHERNEFGALRVDGDVEHVAREPIRIHSLLPVLRTHHDVGAAPTFGFDSLPRRAFAAPTASCRSGSDPAPIAEKSALAPR